MGALLGAPHAGQLVVSSTGVQLSVLWAIANGRIRISSLPLTLEFNVKT